MNNQKRFPLIHKDNLPLVSIITPTFNRANFLEETILSIINQDYPHIEYIVLDDGSTDNTQEIIEKYRDKLYYEKHPNMGETATVNKGFQIAHGEILCVVNSDDPLLQTAVSTAVEILLQNPYALAAYPDWLEIDINSKPIKEHRLPDYCLWTMLREFNVSIGPGTFIKSKAFEIIGFRDKNYRYVGDLDYWFKLASLNALIHIPHIIATHRTHTASASYANKGSVMAGELIHMVHNLFKNKSLPKWAKKMRSYTFSIAHHDAVFFCGSNHAIRFFHRVKSFLYNPLIYAYRCAYGVDMPCRAKFFRKAWDIACKLGAKLPQPPLILEQTEKSNVVNAVPKFAFVSHVLPPSWSGQAVVIERLLNTANPDNYCLISIKNYSEVASQENNRRLSGKYFVLPKENEKLSTSRIKAIKWVGLLVRIFQRASSIAKIAKAEQCKLILAGTGDPYDLPASFLASVILHIPFIPYLFDDFTYQWTDPTVRSFAAFTEKIMFPNSAKIIVPNEFLREEIIKRHGIVSIIIRNPSDDSTEKTELFSKPHLDTIDIVYTGAIYHVNISAFLNIITAIEKLGNKIFKLHLFTAQSISWLESQGIRGENVFFHQHIPPEEVAEAQSKADILLIPFSFDSTVPEIIQTSAPGKLGDYLSSGTPILAYVPPDSFVNWYLNKYKCGLVISENNADAVSEGLNLFIQNHNLSTMISNNAHDRARIDFHPNVSRYTFFRVLELFI